MSILLERDEIETLWQEYEGMNDTDDWLWWDEFLCKAQSKKLAQKLQSIYNLPDGGMFHKKLGDFILSLLEEVDI